MNLTPEQIRVLGCLVEKEATTPDAYPLSTNALLMACNQRTSREPVVDYDENLVTASMLSLRELELARTSRGEGSRVYKHAHRVRDALGLDGAALAVLSILMLRGPQTLGELRGRSERQHSFGTLDEVETALRDLAGREPPLVHELPRGWGQKEVRWSHLLGERVADTAPSDAHEARLPLEAEVASLREEVAALRRRVDALEARPRAVTP